MDLPALPQDDSGHGFDNIAGVLSMSQVLVERYIASAQKMARLALGDTHIAPTVDDFDAFAELRASRGIRGGRNERISEDLPFDSARGISLGYTFPVNADYEVSIKPQPLHPESARSLALWAIPSNLGLWGMRVILVRVSAQTNTQIPNCRWLSGEDQSVSQRCW